MLNNCQNTEVLYITSNGKEILVKIELEKAKKDPINYLRMEENQSKEPSELYK